MTYLYKCNQCDKVNEINKPIAESSRVEKCKVCDSEMSRVYSVGGIKTSDGVKN